MTGSYEMKSRNHELFLLFLVQKERQIDWRGRYHARFYPLEEGSAKMVDVSNKDKTARTAFAQSSIIVSHEGYWANLFG